MGPAIVLGAYYVMALTFSWSALWASVALGFLVAGILHANNIRDIETDGLHGKHTLATILGREGAIWELITLDVLAYATTLIAIFARSLPWTGAAGADHASARARSDPNRAQHDRCEEAESRAASFRATAHGVRHPDDHRVRGGGHLQMVAATYVFGVREQIRDRITEVERQIDDQSYRPGPWDKLLKDARMLPREDRERSRKKSPASAASSIGVTASGR